VASPIPLLAPVTIAVSPESGPSSCTPSPPTLRERPLSGPKGRRLAPQRRPVPSRAARLAAALRSQPDPRRAIRGPARSRRRCRRRSPAARSDRARLGETREKPRRRAGRRVRPVRQGAEVRQPSFGSPRLRQHPRPDLRPGTPCPRAVPLEPHPARRVRPEPERLLPPRFVRLHDTHVRDAGEASGLETHEADGSGPDHHRVLDRLLTVRLEPGCAQTDRMHPVR
jgi:hypothetical protein